MSRVQISPGALIKMDKIKQKYPEVSVGALILNKRGEILLVISRKWPGVNKYTMPGGHIEAGERIEEALKREVKEEVGLEIKPIKFLTLQEAIFSKEFFKPKHFIFLDFLCKSLKSHVKLDGDELQEHLWVNPKKTLSLNIDSFTRKAIKKYLEMKE